MQMLAFACAAMDLPFDFRLLPRNYPHPEDSRICEPMPNFQLKLQCIEKGQGSYAQLSELA